MHLSVSLPESVLSPAPSKNSVNTPHHQTTSVPSTLKTLPELKELFRQHRLPGPQLPFGQRHSVTVSSRIQKEVTTIPVYFCHRVLYRILLKVDLFLHSVGGIQSL